jgi:hypothetical protein
MGRLFLLQLRLQVGYFALQLGRSVRRLLRPMRPSAIPMITSLVTRIHAGRRFLDHANGELIRAG